MDINDITYKVSSLELKKISGVYELSTDAVIEVFEDGALILNVRDSSLTEINRTARDILRATDGKTAIKDVVEKYANLYKINEEIALRDVIDIYTILIKHGLLVHSKVKEKAGKNVPGSK